MRIECESCGHLGEGGVRQTSLGLGLECGQCGYIMLLDADAPGPREVSAPAAPTTDEIASVTPPGAQPEPSAPPEPEPPAPESAARALEVELTPVQALASEEERDEAEERDVEALLKPRELMVERGAGEHRCPKCGWRQDDPDACHRCGLSFERARSGRRPWESVPAGKETAAAELDRRWDELVAGDFMEAERHDAFIQLASRAGLLERAASRYRFYAQDHADTPEGRLATTELARIIELLNAQFMMMGGSGGAGAKAFKHQVSRFKIALYVLVVAMCAGVLWLAVTIFKPFG